MNHLDLSIELIPFDLLTMSETDSNIIPTCISSDGDMLPIPSLSIIFPVEPVLIVSPQTANKLCVSHFSTRMFSMESIAKDDVLNIIIACFSIENITHYFPDESIINQLFYPRNLDINFIDDIAKIYDIPREVHNKLRNTIENITEESNLRRENKGFKSTSSSKESAVQTSTSSSKTFTDKNIFSRYWKKIAKILHENHYDEDLYRIISLRFYHQFLQLPLKEHISSLVTFVEASNLVVRQIMCEIDNLSPADLITKEFCKKNGIDFKFIQYQESIVKYFDLMLPVPLNFISNIERNIDLNGFFINKSNEYEKHPDREVIFPENSRQRVYVQRIPKSEKIKRVLFPTYYRSISAMYAFWTQLHTECPEIARQILNQNEKNLEIQSHSQSKNVIDEELSILCQCQFCNLFSTMKMGRGHNEPSYHCGRTPCNNSYDAWLKHLNRNGYKLRARLD